jgi:aspartate kinase
MIVLKFGGTSVGSDDAIRRAASIVRSRLSRQPLVVVSAMSGTTNALLALAEQAGKGHLIGALRGVEVLRERHLAECEKLLGSSDLAGDVAADLSAAFDELASLAEALSVLGHVTPRSFDAIAAIGEDCSSRLVGAVLRQEGIDSQVVDPRLVLATSDRFMQADPLPDIIAERTREKLLPLLNEGKVPVLGGFIGATSQGITTTLGRGGGDYSASLFGAAMQAEAIEIWTDVDGMLTADPRVVEGAHLIEQIRFDEASELASFGAKVLHPSTIAPAVRRGIPVYVFNSRKPDGTGTRITFDAPRRPVSAIAGKTGVTVIKVRAPKMLLAHGFLRTVFELFARHETSVDVVATSEVSLSVTVEDTDHLDDLIVDLSHLGDVSVERDRGILAIVGSGISDDAAAMGRALGCLDSTRIHMASLSATGINLTLIVDGDMVTEGMRRLHREFFGAGVK